MAAYPVQIFLLLIVLVTGLVVQAGGYYDFLGVDKQVLPEDFLEEYEEIRDYVMEQKEAEEFVAKNEEIEDTLSNGENGLQGYVDLRGYMVTESQELFNSTHQVVYFAFSESTDDTVTAALGALVDGGNTVNRRSGETYYLGLGCQVDDKIENNRFVVSGTMYDQLKSSSSANKVQVRAFFSPSPGVGGPCLSYASGIQVL